jgi:hypothetical protein
MELGGQAWRRGLGPTSGGQEVASMAEGGWRQRNRREVKEGVTSEVGDEAATRSKVGDEVVASSKAGDEVVVCYRTGIEDGRRQRGGVWSNRRERERERALGGFEKLLSVARESVETEILGHGHLMRYTSVLRMSPFSSDGRHA